MEKALPFLFFFIYITLKQGDPGLAFLGRKVSKDGRHCAGFGTTKRRRTVTLGCGRGDQTVCRWRAAAPVPANGTPKTGCLKLPRPGTSSPGAPQPRVQPAPSPEERITDLAREAVCRSSHPPPYSRRPNPLFNNLKQNYSPRCVSRGKNSFSTCTVLRQRGQQESTL